MKVINTEIAPKIEWNGANMIESPQIGFTFISESEQDLLVLWEVIKDTTKQPKKEQQ